MEILITGGAGFIGANIAASYLKQAHQVTIFDNFSRAGVKNNISWLENQFSSKQIRVIEANVSDQTAVNRAIKNKDIVYHFAGQTAVTTSINNPRLDFESNALGSFNIVEACREYNPEAIICYASTNKVYGALNRVKTKARGKRYVGIESASVDESEQLDFYSPYGCSKGIGDQYMHDYARIFGLKTIVFRQSCIYGAHQFGVEDQGWVAHFTAQVIKGEPLKIFGDGKQVRDLLYISDLVKAFHLATENSKTTSGQVYNIGGGIENSASLLELIEILETVTGKKIPTKFLPQRLGDQEVYISDTDKAFRDFGWRPQVSVPEGIEKLFSWLSDYLT